MPPEIESPFKNISFASKKFSLLNGCGPYERTSFNTFSKCLKVAGSYFLSSRSSSQSVNLRFSMPRCYIKAPGVITGYKNVTHVPKPPGIPIRGKLGLFAWWEWTFTYWPCMDENLDELNLSFRRHWISWALSKLCGLLGPPFGNCFLWISCELHWILQDECSS
jgi:hypothetical protein